MATLFDLKDEILKGAKIRVPYWDAGDYITYKSVGCKFVTENGEDYDIETEILFSNEWELYQEPVDWERIINDRCLCWLWDDNFKWAICGTLANVEKGSEYRFIMSDDAGNRSSYKHCRPVRRDEISFYDEKEKTDEQ